MQLYKMTDHNGMSRDSAYDRTLALTGEGRAHPIFTTENAAAWNKIPPILSLFTGGTLSPGATTLITAETPGGRQPVLVIQKYGQGKVAAILTDSLWRWQLAPGKINYYYGSIILIKKTCEHIVNATRRIM